MIAANEMIDAISAKTTSVYFSFINQFFCIENIIAKNYKFTIDGH